MSAQKLIEHISRTAHEPARKSRASRTRASAFDKYIAQANNSADRTRQRQSVTSAARPGNRMVFLAYAHEDYGVVRRIERKLRRDGYTVWMDETDLMPGDRWEFVIKSVIREAAYFVAFISATSTKKKGYFREEVQFAITLLRDRPFDGRFIVPVLLERCDAPSELGEFHQLKYWKKGSYSKLKQVLL